MSSDAPHTPSDKKTPSRLAFDFGNAVAEGIERYPQLRDTTLFSRSSDGEVFNREALAHMRFPDTALARVEDALAYARKHKISIADTNAATAILVLHDDASASDQAIKTYFSFDHEMAHILIREAQPPFTYPSIECMADAFAAIRAWQRFGADAEDFLRGKSDDRLRKFLIDGISSHLTSPVIDMIVNDAKTVDFAALSPEETIIYAKRYAEQWTPSQRAIDKTNIILEDGDIRDKTDAQKLALLAAAAVKSGDPFTVYIGLRAQGHHSAPPAPPSSGTATPVAKH